MIRQRRRRPDASDGGSDTSTRVPDSRRLAITLFGLALGRDIGDATDVDWRALLRFAARERCAALAWHRSGGAIRRGAPSAVSADWRAAAVECHAHGARQLHILGETVSALAAARLDPVVLKGLPLAQRLYGSASVRGSADLDVFVPVAARPAAERVLAEMGWAAFEGTAPWTQTLALSDGGHQHFLELHSSLLDVNLMHLGAPPPRARAVTIDGIVLPAHQDTLLPAYLASHAAKHMPIALLYHVDFLSLWSSLSEGERADATAAASRVGLRGYLRWAVRCGHSVAASADGDVDALRVLGIGPTGRRVYHAMFRDITLAQTPFDAGRSVAAWLWPPQLRDGIAPMAKRWVARVRKPWLEYIVPTTDRRGGPEV